MNVKGDETLQPGVTDVTNDRCRKSRDGVTVGVFLSQDPLRSDQTYGVEATDHNKKRIEDPTRIHSSCFGSVGLTCVVYTYIHSDTRRVSGSCTYVTLEVVQRQKGAVI